MDRDHSGALTRSHTRTRCDSGALWDWNLKSDRVHYSPQWIALVGCEDHEVGSVSEDWLHRVHPDDSAQLLREIETVRAGDSNTFSCRYRLRHRNGTYRWMSCRGTVVRDREGRAVRLTGSQSDVTVEMVTDPLTGLPNRLLLVDRVAHSIDRVRRYNAHFAVLLIDIGRASVEPPSGRGISEALLTAVARRLETCLRRSETTPSLRHNDLVARVEGDCFAILLDGLKDISHAKVAADRLLGEILKPFVRGGREVRLTASIGIAVSATGYTHPDEVLRDADAALHRARVLGGSHCELFDTAILKSEQAELQLEGDFAAALERREFELLYQPIVSLASNDVVGFEALVRWRHPVLGTILPHDFIPIAERTGFIVPLGNWILREACVRMSEWVTAMPSARERWVSVNVSSEQWSDSTLIDQIAEALHESGLDSRRLVLELTEGIAVSNPTALTTLLMRLRAMGVRTSVDDFGTGYSSLAYLRQFPIDTLKIDRSFVREMTTNKDTAEIVTSLINMSRQLGLNVVAEGIEHEDQYVQLGALKCDAGQGHYFAKPLEVEQAAEVLKTGLVPPSSGRPDKTAVRRAEPRMWLRSDFARVIARPRRALTVAAVAMLSLAGLVVMVDRSAAVVRPAVAPQSAAVPIAPGERPIAPTTSLDVIHLHRFGSCRGLLGVTRDGVAFLSTEGKGDEAFMLKDSEFIHGLSEGTLTLMSATRTDRFKAAGSPGENTNQLRELADRIGRSRR